MSASVAWALLATRAGGACLLLSLYGWPALGSWYRLLQTGTAPLPLAQAMALGLGLFASALCPWLVAIGAWPRLAAATITVWLGATGAAGEVGVTPGLLLLLFAVLSVTGAGPLSLPAALRHARGGHHRADPPLPQRREPTAPARH